MQPGQLRVEVPQLEATAGEWSQRSATLAALTLPSPGQPFQPTTAAVSSAHTAVGLARSSAYNPHPRDNRCRRERCDTVCHQRNDLTSRDGCRATQVGLGGADPVPGSGMEHRASDRSD
ncbi:conserved hypothetical protein [Mycobacterium ulcerans Agy99]|uniref:Uncharacterized protein n=1 Tax=Mycobacterium ulcerans (strain Agy99) TaxID=362242 RepID=A0PMZ4_MYCUA|nr:conserved hypothetical protein [Mycobacterium ulcerans Agy99]